MLTLNDLFLISPLANHPKMNRIRSVTLTLLAIACLAHSSVAQDVKSGHRLYARLCASCHGANLQGGSGPSLVDAEWTNGSERPQIVNAIAQGVPDKGMPAFGATLNSTQINQIVDFIQASGQPGDLAAAAPIDTLETLDYSVNMEIFADGLEIPWAIDFLDVRTALITERPGRLRVVRDGVLAPDPVADTPEVLHEGQGGLLDVTVDPNYAQNGWIYLSYSHALSQGGERVPAMTRVVRGRIRDNRWVDQEVLFEAPHETYLPTRQHFGSRIVFDPAGNLYFSIGDRGQGEMAQDLSKPNGKIHRIRPDGSIPSDNPFAGRPDALPSIFSYGHRNPQGVAVHPTTGEVWNLEHGPRGGDELNRVQAGRNYGWPVITYGINYNGTIITEERRREGMEQPVFYWRPSLAVSGLAFYDADLFPYWKGKLLVSSLAANELRLLELDGNRVMHEEVILKGAGRIRESVVGPDGAIYVVLNEPDRVVRLSPWQDLSMR